MNLIDQRDRIEDQRGDMFGVRLRGFRARTSRGAKRNAAVAWLYRGEIVSPERAHRTPPAAILANDRFRRALALRRTETLTTDS